MSDNDFEKKTGKGMIILAWIILLMLLSFYFSFYLERQKNPNRNLTLEQSGNIKQTRLQRNRAGHYVANGMINNRPVVFLLDTGATDIAIPAKIAEDLGLTPGAKMSVYTANGRINVYATLLDSVNLGGIKLYGVRAGINPYMGGDEVLLGMSFLKHLEFSQKGDELLIRQY